MSNDQDFADGLRSLIVNKKMIKFLNLPVIPELYFVPYESKMPPLKLSLLRPYSDARYLRVVDSCCTTLSHSTGLFSVSVADPQSE